MEGYGNENPGAFQPTRPLRGATVNNLAVTVEKLYFNPRAPCGARLFFERIPHLYRHISTHAPLAGRDHCRPQGRHTGGTNFNPRAPCGARPNAGNWTITDEGFQPTRPLRGATERAMNGILRKLDISTHAPLAGRDDGAFLRWSSEQKFQPTRPLRGATSDLIQATQITNISTHAPLAGRDLDATNAKIKDAKFQPTRPLRGATIAVDDILDNPRFQPTRPLRGATC